MLNLLFTLLVLVTFNGCNSGNTDSAAQVVNQPMPLQNIYVTNYGEIKKGQGMYQALKSVSINNGEALKLVNALRDEVEFSKLKVGDKLEATFNHDKKLVKFSLAKNRVEKHIVKLNEATEKWDYSFKELKTFWVPRILEGELKPGSTLEDDLLASGLRRSVVSEIVNVLLCKVNFRMNARKGDHFKVLLNERKYKNTIIETKILYTSYKGRRAGAHEAFLYEDEEKRSTYTAHYTEDGEALIRSGLRYPLSRLHVRSSYGWRRHPVTGKRAMHRGVDLRARHGKPVHAVASGKIIMSGHDKFAGNKIAIRHRDGSTSYYFHLHKRRVNKGAWVRSHQIIGTVGSTGRVTGPHLHFGFKKSNGRWMNPLNKRMIASPKLKGKRYAKLQKQIFATKGLVVDFEIIKDARYIVANIPAKKQTHELNRFPNIFP